MSNGVVVVPCVDEAAHVEPVGVGPAVHQLVHGTGEAVEGEHHVDPIGEQLAEEGVVHAVRVVLRPGQRHQVDDVDHPDDEVGQHLPQQLGGRHGLHGDHVAGRGQHDVGIAAAVVVARPGPDAGPVGAVRDRLVDGQPLLLRLLVDDDQVDVALRPQAVVPHRQQRVGVRRQVDPGDVAPLGDHVLDQTGPLVGEPVVVVAPGGRGQQDVQAGHLGPPRQVVGLLQPLAVLDGLRGADHGERLVGGEQPVPSGQRVALQPAVAVVLAEHLHHPAVGGELHVLGGDRLHEGPVGHLEDGAEPVASSSRRGRTVGSCPGCGDRSRPSSPPSAGSTRPPCPGRSARPRSPGSPAGPGRW